MSAQFNIPATLEGLLLPNESQLTTLASVLVSNRLFSDNLLALKTMLARILPQTQLPSAQPNVPAILGALFLLNELQSTIPAGIPVSRLLLGNIPGLKTMPAKALPQAQLPGA